MPVYIPNLEMAFASIIAGSSLHAAVNGDFSCYGQVIGSISNSAFTVTAACAWNRLQHIQTFVLVITWTMGRLTIYFTMSPLARRQNNTNNVPLCYHRVSKLG